MSDVLTIQLGARTARLHVSDADIATDLTGRVEGFTTTHSEEPWLLVEVDRLEPGIDDEKLLVLRSSGDSYFFERSGLLGELCRTPPYRAKLRAKDDHTVARFLYLSLSLLMPAEGGVLFHADCVETAAGAVAFLGASGAGKSTAAMKISRQSGAHTLSVDRSLIMAGQGESSAHVVTLPRLTREERLGLSPRSVPLAAAVFPFRAPRLSFRPLLSTAATVGLLRSAIVPNGEALPVAAVLDTCRRIATRACVGDIGFSLSDDGEAVATRIGVGRCRNLRQSPSSDATTTPRTEW
jgi:hypothetical protein